MESDVTTLNYSDFKTVFIDQFGYDTGLNGALWSDSWGNADQFSFGGGALTLTSTAADNWNDVGFMQAPTGKSAGEGYGLYQFTGYANAGQGVGICFIMWRADNVLLDPSSPNVATEIDILESWDGTQTGESTIHYYNAGVAGDDGQEFNSFKINLTQVHTYAMDWERGSLTFYVDGQEIYQDTTHAPLDYADGGSNEVMGAELLNEPSLVTTPTVQLHITQMEYSAPVTAGAPLPAPPVSTPGGGSGTIVLAGGDLQYSAASGETVQAGSGNDTITAAAGMVFVTGGSGQLTFFGGSAPSQASGGAGSATIFGGSGGGNYTGGSAGHDVLVSEGASGSNTTLTGAAAGDQLFGSAKGNDLLVAATGRESVLGGGGNTTIVGGGTAASVIFTGSGTTTVFGGVAGGDIIVGGSGGFGVTAQKGDAIFGNSGALNVTGSTSGADSIVGGAGALTVTGRGANMLVVASTSTSDIQIGNGASLIFGGTGDSTITGGNGSMELVVGSGKATVNEGNGPAIYDLVKGSAGGSDVLNGFKPGTDKIILYGYQASQQNVVDAGGTTVLTLSDGTRIQLAGVSDPGSSIIG